MANKDGTWLREISSCCCLTTAGKTRQLLLNKIYIPFLPSLYIFVNLINHQPQAEWDSVSRERIELATDPYKHADLAAVVMQEGLANVCLVTSCMTIVRWV